MKMEENSEAGIEVERLAGIADVERKLVDRYLDDLRRLGRHWLSERMQRIVSATDIANKALQSAIAKAKRSEAPMDEASFRPFVIAIARNKMRDEIRRAGTLKRGISKTESLSGDRLISGGQSPLEEVLFREMIARVNKFFESEREPTRRLMNYLWAHEGYSTHEIAEFLEAIPEEARDEGIQTKCASTVRLYLVSMRKRLAAILDEVQADSTS